MKKGGRKWPPEVSNAEAIYIGQATRVGDALNISLGVVILYFRVNNFLFLVLQV
jgi:hypothetical protein